MIDDIPVQENRLKPEADTPFFLATPRNNKHSSFRKSAENNEFFLADWYDTNTLVANCVSVAAELTVRE